MFAQRAIQQIKIGPVRCGRVVEMRSLCVTFLCGAAAATSSGLGVAGAGSSLPTLEVSLDPPADPSPELAARIASLDEAREARQAANMEALNRKFNAILASASGEIASLASRARQVFTSAELQGGVAASAFVQTGTAARAADGDVTSVSIRAHLSATVGASALDAVADFEDARGRQEDSMFAAAAAELQSLSDMVLAEANSAIQGAASKLAGAGAGLAGRGAGFLEVAAANARARAVEQGQEGPVRVVPSDAAYPTAQSMVADMQARRSVSEDFERASILHLQLMLLDAEIMMLEGALGEAVGEFTGRA